MSVAIRFLETLGSAPAQFAGQTGAYLAAIDDLDVDETQRLALRARDPAALGALLEVRTHMVCAVCTPDGNEPESVPGDDRDGDGVPDDQEPVPERD